MRVSWEILRNIWNTFIFPFILYLINWLKKGELRLKSVLGVMSIIAALLMIINIIEFLFFIKRMKLSR